MSDTLWGVIVGGLIVIVGNIVAGLFQKHQTKINIDARRAEQSRQFEFDNEQKAKQLEFEKEQQVITHSIEERKKWIEPLRTSLTEYSRNAIEVNDFLSYVRLFNTEPESVNSTIDYISDLKKA